MMKVDDDDDDDVAMSFTHPQIIFGMNRQKEEIDKVGWTSN